MNAPVPVQLPHTPTRIGQGTAIEQSRAAAEVFASVMAADAKPRDVQAAIRALEETCGMKELAEHAFFRFSRGGQQVTGPTIHLARELARCWGNIQYGVAELRRDDAAQQSEMQAFAWDLETNARNASIFIVPHRRDKRGGSEPITDARDVYENNANAGARRVREAIFAVLPLWFVERGKAMCIRTLEHGGGKPLPERIAAAIKAFAEINVSEDRLAAKVGRPAKVWTALDLAPLSVVLTSIKRGEATVDEEFPLDEQVVTVGEIAAARPARRRTPPAEPKAADPLDPAEQEIADQVRREQELADQGGQQ